MALRTRRDCGGRLLGCAAFSVVNQSVGARIIKGASTSIGCTARGEAFRDSCAVEESQRLASMRVQKINDSRFAFYISQMRR